MIASHYSEPLERLIAVPSALRCEPADDAATVAMLPAGEPFRMLDNSLGWAWGYGGAERRVGYVRSDCLAPR